MSRALPEPDVEGRPVLLVPDEDREGIADALAELLVAALERDSADRPA